MDSLWQKKTLIVCIDNLPSPGALAPGVEWILFGKKTLNVCIDNLPWPGALAPVVEWILFGKKKDADCVRIYPSFACARPQKYLG